MTQKTPTAFIVGASRGLGLGLAEEYLKRGWRVVGTVRGSAHTKLHDLAERSGGRLEIETLDIVEQGEIAALRQRLAGRSFDLLFVNAGVANDPGERIGDVSTADFTRILVTNALSPMRVIEAFQDLVPAGGTIGVMSSGLASIAANESGGWEVYRASKAALNMLMRSFAARNPQDPRALLVLAPGWIRTDMGGPGATYSVEESIPPIVDVILAQAGKKGLRYLDRDGQAVAW